MTALAPGFAGTGGLLRTLARTQRTAPVLALMVLSTAAALLRLHVLGGRARACATPPAHRLP
ncbi:hypothetical protein ACFC5X_20650 [Streptomyces sp. NPDC055952]|uniref:hypothetical protein n=1 Tax=Streptomyces sp. NPDC055952 TaxID=3345663 RepID=UPI0035D78A72